MKKVNEDMFINTEEPMDAPAEPVETTDCVTTTAEQVMDAYQSANKWLDIIKESLYHKMGCVFFSSFVHNLAHTMPERFDKFGDILHTVNMEIPYPATNYIPNVPEDINGVFEGIFMCLDHIKDALNEFIKCTDNEYHGMACAAEGLLNDIEGEYPMLYRLKQEWEQCGEDNIKFDKYVNQYVKNKGDLLESMNNVPEVEEKAIPTVDITMAKAKITSEKKAEEAEEQGAIPAEKAIKQEPITGHNKKDYPKKVEMPKATLDESLFEEAFDTYNSFDEWYDKVAENWSDCDCSWQSLELAFEAGYNNEDWDQFFNEHVMDEEEDSDYMKIAFDAGVNLSNGNNIIDDMNEGLLGTIATVGAGALAGALAGNAASKNEELNEGQEITVINDLTKAAESVLFVKPWRAKEILENNPSLVHDYIESGLTAEEYFQKEADYYGIKKYSDWFADGCPTKFVKNYVDESLNEEVLHETMLGTILGAIVGGTTANKKGLIGLDDKIIGAVKGAFSGSAISNLLAGKGSRSDYIKLAGVLALADLTDDKQLNGSIIFNALKDIKNKLGGLIGNSDKNETGLDGLQSIMASNEAELNEGITAAAAAAAISTAAAFVAKHWDQILDGMTDLGVSIDKADQNLVNIIKRHKDLKQDENISEELMDEAGARQKYVKQQMAIADNNYKGLNKQIPASWNAAKYGAGVDMKPQGFKFDTGVTERSMNNNPDFHKGDKQADSRKGKELFKQDFYSHDEDKLAAKKPGSNIKNEAFEDIDLKPGEPTYADDVADIANDYGIQFTATALLPNGDVTMTSDEPFSVDDIEDMMYDMPYADSYELSENGNEVTFKFNYDHFTDEVAPGATNEDLEVGCDDCGYSGTMTDADYENAGGKCPNCGNHHGGFHSVDVTDEQEKAIECYIESFKKTIDEEYASVPEFIEQDMQNGNAFWIMGYCANAMKECGLSDEIEEMRDKAMSGDYDNLCTVCDEYIQKCNQMADEFDDDFEYEVKAKDIDALNNDADFYTEAFMFNM